MRVMRQAILIFVLISIVSVAQEPITLQKAVTIALEKNPLHKAELAGTRSAVANVGMARSAFMPRVQFSETYLRGNDPVYVFGSKLRQQRFSTNDFALNALNTPTPFGNFTSRFAGQWQLFNSGQSYFGVQQARAMENATRASLERADQELIFRVVQAYFAVLTAKRQVAVAEASEKTAQAIVDRSRSRVQAGVAVEADLLSSQVYLASRQQELIAARNGLELARANLLLQMGTMDGTAEIVNLENAIAAPSPEVAAAFATALERRPDLRRMRSETEASRLAELMARASFGPKLNAFANYQWDKQALFSGGGQNWTAGVELHVELFSGGEKKARLSQARANDERVRAMLDYATNAVRLEVHRAFLELDTARRQAEVAHAATQQAEESLRIHQNRYDAGLTTLTDLLRVEEEARRTQTQYWEAAYRVQTNSANLELAMGTLTPESAVVK